MISKRFRLTRALITGLRGAPTVFSSPLFAAKARSNNLAFNRFAVVIPNAAVKTSAGRHRLRRLMLDACGRWPAKGRDVVIVAHRRLADSPESAIVGTLRRAAAAI